MKRYDAYKDSGIEWIGVIPEHWEVKRLKYVLRINSGEGIKSEEIKSEGTYPVFGGNGIVGYTENFNSNNTDIIIGRVGANCGNVRLVKNEKWISDNALLAALTSKDSIEFITIQLQVMNLNNMANQNAQPLITGTMVKEKEALFPPIQEQHAIAAYLDHKTAEIDALIADKKRLLELYEEEKTALINQAVTKGITPGVPMKDSGVEWLGEVPEHWEVKRFRYLYGIITEKIDRDLPKIGLENIESGSGKYIRSDSEFEGDGVFFKQNDILFGKLRPYLAKVLLADFEGSAVGDFFVFRPSEKIFPQYGKYFLLSKNFIDVTNSSTFGSKMPRVSWDFISDLKIPSPPLPEQHAIVRHIESECALIDAKKAKTEALVSLLLEYRTALISEVVTGKIKIID